VSSRAAGQQSVRRSLRAISIRVFSSLRTRHVKHEFHIIITARSTSPLHRRVSSSTLRSFPQPSDERINHRAALLSFPVDSHQSTHSSTTNNNQLPHPTNPAHHQRRDIAPRPAHHDGLSQRFLSDNDSNNNTNKNSARWNCQTDSAMMLIDFLAPRY